MRVLSPTEFVRTKVKAWAQGRSHRRSRPDRHHRDILWMLQNERGFEMERLNPDEGMQDLAQVDEEVAVIWSDILRRHGVLDHRSDEDDDGIRQVSGPLRDAGAADYQEVWLPRFVLTGGFMKWLSASRIVRWLSS